ncbi:MAG: hypothetical protein FWH17_09955 [Oscillospiraceae bacterium]|nr:hypothetical protein [Oscillospiraceae bacterium]
MKRTTKKANTLKRIMAILLAIVMMNTFTVALADYSDLCDVCGEETAICVCASAGGVEPIAQVDICADCGQEESDCECTAADGGESDVVMFAPSSFEFCLDCGEAEDDCVCTVTVPVPASVATIDALLEAIAIAEQNGEAATILLTSQIDIPAGQTAEIKSDVDITLTINANHRHFYVEGALTMGDGITLTRAELYTGVGGGVDVVTGNFIMTGGTISDNRAVSGGGVYLSNSSTFTMEGGEISGNTAQGDGGGVYLRNSSTFTMEGGEISGNTAQGGSGGGVYAATSSNTFSMSGGEISGNMAQGYGGGVFISNSSTFTMEGGEISGNKAKGYGGGVYVGGPIGTFSMSGGEISGNTANRGGGVYVTGSFTIEGGEISGNTAEFGGGVFVDVDSNSTFTMEGGEISGNSATGVTFSGGGVFVAGTFNMTGGKISGNMAQGDGGGVYVGGTFNMTGGEISGNTGTFGGGIFTLKGTFAQGFGLNKLFINPEKPIIFKNNTATDAIEYMIMEGTPLFDYYRERISLLTDDNWSWGLKYGFNNHDIGTNLTASELEGNFIDPSLPSKPETPKADVDSDEGGNLLITIEVDGDDDYYVIEIEDEDIGDIIIIIEKDEDGKWVAKDEDAGELDYEVKDNEDGTITIIVDDLDDGTYKVRVRAGRRGKNGDTAESDTNDKNPPVEIVNPTAPTAPQNFMAAIGPKRAELSWEAPENDGGSAITHYQIRQKVSDSANWGSWYDVGDALSYSDVDSSSATFFTAISTDYQVRAVNAAGFSEPSEMKTAWAYGIPNTNRGTVTGGYREITLELKTYSPNIDIRGGVTTGFQIRYSRADGAYGDWITYDIPAELLATGNGIVQTYVIDGLEDGVQYKVQYRAVNEVGPSNNSYISNATTVAPAQHAADCDCDDCNPPCEDNCDCDDCNPPCEDDCDCDDCKAARKHDDDCDCSDCIAPHDDCDCDDCTAADCNGDCDCDADCAGDCDCDCDECEAADGNNGNNGDVSKDKDKSQDDGKNNGNDAVNNDDDNLSKDKSQDDGDSLLTDTEDGSDSQTTAQPGTEAATAGTPGTTPAPTPEPTLELTPEPTPEPTQERPQSDDGFVGSNEEYMNANNSDTPLANIGERQAINNGLSSLSVLAMANMAALLILLALLFLFVVWKRRDEEEEEEIAEIKEGEE